MRIAILVALLVAGAAHADEKPLTGSYEIGGATLVDPPPGEDPGSRFRVFLTGAAAKDLYDALHATAEDDECLGDGSKAKTSGGIVCRKLAEDGSYECAFAVGVDGRTVDGATSC